jgi:hypothetical protein
MVKLAGLFGCRKSRELKSEDSFHTMASWEVQELRILFQTIPTLNKEPASKQKSPHTEKSDQQWNFIYHKKI